MFTCLKKPPQSSSRNNSARVSGQGRDKPPAHRANQIAGFGEFRGLINLEKIQGYIPRIACAGIFSNNNRKDI